MKKLLLAGTALVGLAALSAPAHAEVKLGLGGFFRGYGVWADSDVDNLHELDLRRDSEIHVSGETVLDNGLTVGFHTEQKLGGTTSTDEAYGYFSGPWGRVNLGSEDGAAYLLQVGAPSADSNVDGLRTYIQGVTAADAIFTAGTGLPGLTAANVGNAVFDYDQVSDPTAANTERLTYLTPKFEGFQAGLSYAPKQGQSSVGTAVMTTDTDLGQYENIWDVSARWDGEFQGFGISVGGGYSNAGLEQDDALVLGAANEDSAPVLVDGLTQWNAGLNLTWNSFSLGGSYLRAETENQDAFDAGDNAAVSDTLANLDVMRETWVIGGAWENGPFHAGVSYLNQNTSRDGAGATADGGEIKEVDAEVEKFTVGGGYTYGPGMTFRGAVAWGSFDNSTVAADAGQAGGFAGAAATNNDFTQVTVGTDIQF